MIEPQRYYDSAVLKAFDNSGNLIEEIVLKLEKYYEELHPLIDLDEYRASKKIRKVVGLLFDSEGKVFQEFCSDYNEKGAYSGGVAKHADGTITSG